MTLVKKNTMKWSKVTITLMFQLETYHSYDCYLERGQLSI